VFRLFLEIFATETQSHADEYWQGTEVAYDLVFGGVELPWEWRPKYRIRNVVYPLFLSIPLWILKFLRLDFYLLVRVAPYLMHLPLVVLGDYYFFKVANRLIGNTGARLSLYLYFGCASYNSYYIRCLGNSVETILGMIAFYHFLDVKNKFDKNVIIMTFCLSISFVIRISSPAGWLPLLFWKLFADKSFFAFLKAGFLIFIPTVLSSIAIDSIYYGELTFSGYGFLKFNIIENKSRFFGVEPMT
jgi:phosphatidylinositol glycan class B